MQIKNINISAPIENKIIGNIAPKNREPTSPIMIFAGVVFHHRNPRHDPAREETNIDKSSDKKELSIKSK
jgi:hypothetical protein|tara:strand:+ start:3668 stop:3877 length:210 start_codon:yes stop_codon:yes gene_type:complete